MGQTAGLLRIALGFREAGRPDQAERIFGRILEMEPDHPEALLAAGLVAQETGRSVIAVAHLEQALACRPGSAIGWNGYGAALEALRNHEPARGAYRRAVALQPDAPAPSGNLGKSLRRANPGMAKRLLGRSLAAMPHQASDRAILAEVIEEDDREQAQRRIIESISLEPGNAAFWLALAGFLGRRGDYVGQGRCGALAAVIEPSLPAAQRERGFAARNRQDVMAAIGAFRRTIALYPGSSTDYVMLAAVWLMVWNSTEAEQLSRMAIRLDPRLSSAWGNLANLFLEQEATDKAIGAARRSLALTPGDPQLRFNLAFLLWKCGDLAAGMTYYEEGLKTGLRYSLRQCFLPRWSGESLAGRDVLVLAEQGLGDEVRFASTFPDLIAEARSVTIECEPRLVSLFRRSFAGADIRPTRRVPEMPDRADCQILAGSLLSRYRRRLADFPDRVGYLVPDGERLAEWRARFADLPPGPKVGIAWRSGRMAYQSFGDVSTVDMWESIFAVPGLVFVNMQYDDCRGELERVKELFGVTVHHWPEVDLRNDIEAAAALGAAVDLGVTVPVSVNDIVGSVGTPCFVMWRGLTSHFGTPYQPIFPRHRLFGRPYQTPMRRSLDRAAEALRQWRAKWREDHG